MKNEKNNSKNCGRKTAAILAVTLIAGFMTGCADKSGNGEDAAKTAEANENVTAVTSDPAPETEETTAEETTAVTTVPETEAPEMITLVVTSPETSLSSTSEDAVKNSPMRNKNHAVYPEILGVLPNLESFNARFSPSLYQQGNECEYRDIVVGADVTYSYNALKPIESGVKIADPVGGAMHSKRYYKVSTLGPDYQNEEYKYKTEEDIRTALEEYFTDSFIDNHYISDYAEVPGRNTVFKMIGGELYVGGPDDTGMMVAPYGNVYNYDGKRCDVKTSDYSPDIHSDPLHVSMVLEDGKWKIDGYEHTGNIADVSTAERDLYNKYRDVGQKAVENLMELEGVVLCCGVTTDENDTLTEEYDGAKVVYKRVTDERFSNVTEIENFICSRAVADLRLRCIDYIRGVNSKYPVYIMSGGALYCNTSEFNKFYCLPEYSKGFSVISADDNNIQLGLAADLEHTHNCMFLKNTADGWRICDLD